MKSVSKIALVGILLARAALSTAWAAPLVPGVNLSGMEINAWTIPGTVNYDYVAPSTAELSYYQSKGIKLVRLPILWERLQPGLLAATPSVALNGRYLRLVKQVVAQAGALGMQVIVDLHDYGGYSGHKLGDGTLRLSAFAGLWRQLASRLAGTPGLAGYDLMNEPSNMPAAAVWPAAAQAAVNAIRAVDIRTPAYVEGDNWASAGAWTTDNNTLAISDPASNLVYEAHAYGDRDNSGTHFTWAAEAAAGVTVQTLAARTAVFSGWCKARQNRCMIGEIGVGNDDPSWNVQLALGLAAMQSGGIMSFTYWAGGPWWGGYPMSIEPTGSGDADQMAVVSLLHW